jgi:hypothetical protein
MEFPIGSLICTKVGTSWGDFCNDCTTWRMLIWKDGTDEYGINESTISTKAFNYYGGHKPCGGYPPNYPLCGEWKSGIFKS